MEIAPLVGLFLAMAALDAGLFDWLRADMAALRDRMAGLEGALTGVSPNSPAAANLGADDPDPEPRP